MYRLQEVISNNEWVRVVIDASVIIFSFLLALAIRYEFAIPSRYLRYLIMVMPAFILLYLLCNFAMRIYSGRYRYAGFDELLNLTISTILSTILLLFAIVLIPGVRKNLSVYVAITGGLICLSTMALVRLVFRFASEMRLRRGQKGNRKVLLVGAGEAGEMVLRDMLRHPEYDYSPIGFIDDDPRKSALVVQGVPVLGSRNEIPRIAERHAIDEIVITVPSATYEEIRGILAICEATGAKIKILPGIVLTTADEIGVAAVRELNLEDLLGREPVETDLESISSYLRGRVVMVTGAGGSIGSELSRQLHDLGLGRLVLLDNAETSLFELDMDFSTRAETCPINVVVADIRDTTRLDAVFMRYRPQVIFHSAASKQVPMMEFHPSEAVKNNVLGTSNLAQLAIKHRVERFILISTDKAVHPINVMGATKRVAEMLMKFYGAKNATLFSAVRFGNVLGSRGSVIPTFKKQIEGGGPLLVTHREVARYFMTVEEAAQLVIQAGAFTKGGDIFMLDMGEPVRIFDLANEMVRLLGCGRDIEIRVVGLRPGEKLHEKLVFQGEEMLPTPHPKITRLVDDFELPEDFEAQVRSLLNAAVRDDEGDIRILLSHLALQCQPHALQEE